MLADSTTDDLNNLHNADEIVPAMDVTPQLRLVASERG